MQEVPVDPLLDYRGAEKAKDLRSALCRSRRGELRFGTVVACSATCSWPFAQGPFYRNSMEELILIKTCTALVATFFAVTSFPLLAQQPTPESPSTRPAMQQAAAGETWPQTQQSPPSTPAATSPAAVSYTHLTLPTILRV